MITKNDVELYINQLGWNVSFSYGKTNKHPCFYPHIWKMVDGKLVDNLYTIIVYRDLNLVEMENVLDAAIKRVVADRGL